MKRITAYRLFLIWTLIVVLIITGLLILKGIRNKVPETIQIMVGEEQEFNFGIPAVGLLYRETSSINTVSDSPVHQYNEQFLKWKLDEKATIVTNVTDNYLMEVRLFGILPIKTVNVAVVDRQLLIPAGKSIGIYVKTQGVMIIDVGEFMGSDGMEKAPCRYILKAGDYIQKINGMEVNSKADVTDIVDESDGEMLRIELLREGEQIETAVRALANEWGEYKLGIWIRDSAQGIGTMTFITADGRFGALGHGITDTDTGDLMKLSEGLLYTTQIAAIRKGYDGSVGEITGIIHYTKEEILGNIFINSNRGIYGKSTNLLTDELTYEAICPGMRQEIELGPATILSDVSGEICEYDVEITAISIEGELAGHQMMIQVMDDRLIDLTGGIVQGMSGSPIIQNNKLIGSVTHVLVNDSTRGYGISIENMLAVMDSSTVGSIN